MSSRTFFAAVACGVVVSVLSGAMAPRCYGVSQCDPGGRPNLWYGMDVESELASAIQTLERYGIDVPRSIVEYENGCKSSSIEGCFVHEEVEDSFDSTWTVPRQVFGPTGYSEPVYCWNPYYGWVQTGCRPVMGWQTVEEPRKRRITRVVDETNAIFIQDCIIRRGWLNMDEGGEHLWDTNNKQSGKEDQYNLYYKYAKSAQEALEFLLAHEIAHYSGVDSEEAADHYARKVIVEVRKMKRGLPYTKWTYRSTYRGPNRNVACRTAWVPPPMDDLPIGGEDMPPPGAR